MENTNTGGLEKNDIQIQQGVMHHLFNLTI